MSSQRNANAPRLSAPSAALFLVCSSALGMAAAHALVYHFAVVALTAERGGARRTAAAPAAGPAPALGKLPAEPRESEPPATQASQPAVAAAPPPPPAEEKPTPPAKPDTPKTSPRRAPPLVRLHDRTAQDVSRQVADLPSPSLDRTAKRAESFEMVAGNLRSTGGDPTLVLLERRPDLAGLPLRRGPERRLDSARAVVLADASRKLQDMGRWGIAEAFAKDRAWQRPDRIPAMMQVLTAEHDESRLALARQLAQVSGPESAEALARIALFDPEPDVRSLAIESLRKHAPGAYRPLLLRGMNYPWPPVAEHAAEALVALKRTEAVPALLALLEAPDPQSPFRKGTAWHVREVVRIHHKTNCLMCHPPSFRATDLVRKEVPRLPDPARPAGFGYGGSSFFESPTGIFVRADVTYLKQDYSIAVGGKRYDLFVRERPSTPADVREASERKSAGTTRHQQAVLFALEQLTGEPPGRGGINWKRFDLEHRVARGR